MVEVRSPAETEKEDVRLVFRGYTRLDPADIGICLRDLRRRTEELGRGFRGLRVGGWKFLGLVFG